MAGSRLGDRATIVMGQSPPGGSTNPTGVGLPLLNGPTEFGPHHPNPVQFTTDGRKAAEPGDLLFCVRGSTTGRMNWADQRYAIGRGIAAIRHADRDIQPLVRAVIERDLSDLLAQATGSTFPNVSARQLANIPWPHLSSQQERWISRLLGALDDKIELNRRMSETLEAMARALFRSWFVDFDPVRAKAEGRDPGLPQPIADLFPDRFEDSELGEVPLRWRHGTVGEIAQHYRRGVDPDELDELDEGSAYIGLEHMPRRSIALSEWGSADGLSSGKFRFQRGEILFGKLRPYFHKVGVAPIGGVCSTDIVVVRETAPEWFGLVLGTLSSEEFVDYTSATSTGTKMPRTSWADMARYPLALPPLPIARVFTDRVRPMIDRIIAAIHEARTLAEIRDALLPKLISGELRVPEAERLLEATPA